MQQAPYLLPFNPSQELQCSRPWADKPLWAGHCIWINFNWMIAVGLAEHGFLDEAREITRRTVQMVLREGFWEFYDSRTGTGCRTDGFTWPALTLAMPP